MGTYKDVEKTAGINSSEYRSPGYSVGRRTREETCDQRNCNGGWRKAVLLKSNHSNRWVFLSVHRFYRRRVPFCKRNRTQSNGYSASISTTCSKRRVCQRDAGTVIEKYPGRLLCRRKKSLL